MFESNSEYLWLPIGNVDNARSEGVNVFSDIADIMRDQGHSGTPPEGGAWMVCADEGLMRPLMLVGRGVSTNSIRY